MPGLVRPHPQAEEDIFESSVNLEDLHYRQGFQEGFENGVEAGRGEGREVGLKSGFQAGEEIGFYSGCVNVWKAAVEINPGAFSSRAKRTVKQFEDQLRGYPLASPEDERLQDLLEAIRVKFRAILSMLSIHLDYPGHPKSQGSVDQSDF